MEKVQRTMITAEDIIEFYNKKKHLEEISESDKIGREILSRVERVFNVIKICHGDHTYTHLNNLFHTTLEFDRDCHGEYGMTIRFYDIWYITLESLLEEEPGKTVIDDRIESMNKDIEDLMTEMGEILEKNRDP